MKNKEIQEIFKGSDEYKNCWKRALTKLKGNHKGEFEELFKMELENEK